MAISADLCELDAPRNEPHFEKKGAVFFFFLFFTKMLMDNLIKMCMSGDGESISCVSTDVGGL